MTRESSTVTDDGSPRHQAATESADNDYDLPVELFAGIVILIMGVLILITPLVTEMPSDFVWNPTLINGISGAIYLVVGAYFIRRAGYP